MKWQITWTSFLSLNPFPGNQQKDNNQTPDISFWCLVVSIKTTYMVNDHSPLFHNQGQRIFPKG